MLYQREIDDSVLIQLIQLHALDKARVPLSHEAMMNIVYEGCNINYGEYIIALDNLVRTNHVKKYLDADGRTMYRLLDKGKHASEFFDDHIPNYISDPIDLAIKPVLERENAKNRVKGGIVPANKGDDFAVECILLDKDGTELMRLEVFAGTREQAVELYSSFKKAPDKLYEAVIRTLSGKQVV